MPTNPRSLLLIVVALLAASGTAMLARGWLQSERPGQVIVQAPAQEVATEVLVTSTSLPAGHIIRFEDLQWRTWPENGITEFYILKGMRSVDDFIGSVVRSGIASGAPINAENFVKPGERGFLAAVLTAGMRAVSVPISATSGISGFVFPGDRVDLILTHEIQNDQGVRHASETALTNVRVLAVDQRTNDQENAPVLAKTATLEVTPKQVEKISVLRRLGSLSLSLRSLSPVARDETSEQSASAHPASGRSHTWDSEVSRLLPPVDGSGQYLQITVARGSEVSSLKFRRGGK
ncbi:MAG: Flp pilus assembly protein CpaB [Sphingomonadales bacterium]